MLGVSCQGLESIVDCSCAGCTCPLDNITGGGNNTNSSKTTTNRPATTESTPPPPPQSTALRPTTVSAATTQPEDKKVTGLTGYSHATHATAVPEPSEYCRACERDFTHFGSECCDLAYLQFNVNCAELEAQYFWDCAGCECAGDATTTPVPDNASTPLSTGGSSVSNTPPPTPPVTSTNAAASRCSNSDCFEGTCDWWVTYHGVTCVTMENTFDCNCEGCSCTPGGFDTTESGSYGSFSEVDALRCRAVRKTFAGAHYMYLLWVGAANCDGTVNERAV